METETKTQARRMRVTFEGDVQIRGGVLHVSYGDEGTRVLLLANDVQTELVAERRSWSDGDVAQGDATWTRCGGRWFGIAGNGSSWGPVTDDEITASLVDEDDPLRVLRYQAGE